MTKILLTGGSGFIAAHVLGQLLDKGYTVVTTVRSEIKAEWVRTGHKQAVEEGRLEVAVVGDIARPGAFDEVAKTPGVEVVVHTASPFHFRWTDAQRDLIDPALNGTSGILDAIHASAPGVRRVVITSSFAAILDEAHIADPEATFSEKSWNPVTAADAGRSPPTAYRASKTLAEQAAWAFVAARKPAWDLVTVCPPVVFGPVAHHLPSLDAINTSNERIVALLRGEWRRAGAVPPVGAVPLWVDVRDAAAAHVRAVEDPRAGGRRLFATAGWFTNGQIADAVRAHFPEYADRVPPESVTQAESEAVPPKGPIFNFDNSATTELLGFEWTKIDKSVVDLVTSLKTFGI